MEGGCCKKRELIDIIKDWKRFLLSQNKQKCNARLDGKRGQKLLMSPKYKMICRKKWMEGKNWFGKNQSAKKSIQKYFKTLNLGLAFNHTKERQTETERQKLREKNRKT